MFFARCANLSVLIVSVYMTLLSRDYAKRRRRRHTCDNRRPGIAVQRRLEDTRQLTVTIAHVAALRFARERRDHTRQHGQTQIDLSRFVQDFSLGSRVFHALRSREIYQRQLANEDTARVRRRVGKVGSQTTLAHDPENRMRSTGLLVHVRHADVTILLAHAKQLHLAFPQRPYGENLVVVVNHLFS